MDYTKVLYLSQDDVKAVNISMLELIEIVEKAFVQMGKGQVEMPPKPGVHPGPAEDNNYIHAMPCYIPEFKSAGMKWVSGYPNNLQRNLPYNNGLLILNDVETGIAKAIMDCVWITSNPTAAASVVSSKYLARPESESIGIFGCGVQGHTNLHAFSVAYKLKKMVCYDPVRSQAEKLAQYSESLGIPATITDNPRDVVADMDIIVSAGPILKKPHEMLEAGWMKEGAFATLVDYDSAWSRAALAELDIYTTDNHDQYNYNRDVNGYFQNCPKVYADLSELVIGKFQGRTSPKQRTAACNLGVALEDMAVAPRIYEKALEMNIGRWLPL